MASMAAVVCGVDRLVLGLGLGRGKCLGLALGQSKGVWGWDLPAGGAWWMILLQFAVVLGKVFALIVLTMMVRWTLPRFRFDQLMKLAWEGLIPLTLVLLLTYCPLLAESIIIYSFG